MLTEKRNTKIKHCCLRFCFRYRWLTVIFLIALILDTVTTVSFMTEGGPQEEYNPVVRMLSENYGIVAGPILGAIYKLSAAIILTFIWEKYARYVLAAACITYSWAAFYNLYASDLYTKGLVGWLPF
jgi:hypothetical protein